MFQMIDNLRYIGKRIETEAVHASIKLDMYRESLYTLLFSSTHKSIEEFETIYFGF